MTPLRHSAHAMTLHWGVVVALGVQFGLAGGMTAAFAAKQQTIELDGAWTAGALAHALVGVVIGLAMLWLLALRRSRDGTQADAHPVHPVSGVIHALFYAVLLAMPVAGGIAWVAGSDSAASLHRIGGHLVLLLAVLHVGVILWHRWHGDRSILRRMLPR